MELTWIDDFIALERVRHFTKAAEMRGTTQSAYSRRIMRLEEWLGCRLFEREVRPVTLTPEGEEFLVRAKRLREEILDTKRAVNVLASHYNRAKKIYTTNSLAVGFFSKWQGQKALQPYSLTVASLTGCVEAVHNGRADHALVPLFEGTNFGELFVEKVGEDRLELMATESIAGDVFIKNRKLYGPLLLYPPATSYGSLINQKLLQEKIFLEREAICESPSAEALHALVTSHMGAAWLPGMLASNNLVKCNVPKSLCWEYDIALVSRQKPLS